MAFALTLLAIAALSGCVGGVEPYYDFDVDAPYKNPGVFEGNYTFGSTSTVLQAGAFVAGHPEVIHLRSTLPAYASPLGETSSDGTVFITMAIWRPMNVTGTVPVIVDAGPYYEIGQHCKSGAMSCQADQLVDDTIDWPGQTTRFSLSNFLPRGYAVVQLAVRGTGTSGGCMDLMGPSEMHDLDQAITYLGEQPWSNGNIAMIGVSYDGSTPWEVAATGNTHLKAIIPVSGLPDIYDLMFHNGTPETRGAYMHASVYWGSGFSDGWPYNQVPGGWPAWPPLPIPPPLPWPYWPGFPAPQPEANGRQPYQDMQNLVCPEAFRGAAMGQVSALTGDRGSAGSDYWTIRDHRQQVLDQYNGSIFLIHGLQDWNVDPHSVVPFNLALRAKGLPMKEWYGQWDHALPDSRCLTPTPDWVSMPCRLDFAEVLSRWLDHYLKGDRTHDLGPSIQVEDNLGEWRNADSFPPAKPDWTPLQLSGDLKLEANGATTATVRLMPTTPNADGTILELVGPELTQDLYISGMPTATLPFVPQGDGGQLGIWLFDMDANGTARAPYAAPPSAAVPRWHPVGVPIIGHGQINLRYYAGGETMQTLTPGTQYVARLQFEPLEVNVPRGHHLVLWVFQGSNDDHQATATPAPVDLTLGPQTVLNLPALTVDPTTQFPVPGIHYPQRSLLENMDAMKPLPPSRSALPPVPIAVGACACGGAL
ncbi:MAG: CocE/NonD family hydrolase [bacterium]